MSRILLADDSPHAQRIGERILREEGFDVVSFTDGETVLLRLAEVDPDVILADAFLPRKSGFDLCRYVKGHPLHRHVRVILTAGLLEQFDEAEATRAGCDAILKKPFEASMVMDTLRPLLAEAQLARGPAADAIPDAGPVPAPVPSPNANPSPASPQQIDAERVEAAVTLALDAALPLLIKEITERVLVALGH